MCGWGCSTGVAKVAQRMPRLAGQVPKRGEERLLKRPVSLFISCSTTCAYLGQMSKAKLVPSAQQVDNTRARAPRN